MPLCSLLAQLKRSGLDGFLADTDLLCWVIPALLHGGAPMVLARTLAARQSRRQGRLPAVRRYWDTMIGAWIGLFKVAFFDLAGVSDARVLGWVARGARPSPALRTAWYLRSFIE